MEPSPRRTHPLHKPRRRSGKRARTSGACAGRPTGAPASGLRSGGACLPAAGPGYKQKCTSTLAHTIALAAPPALSSQALSETVSPMINGFSEAELRQTLCPCLCVCVASCVCAALRGYVCMSLRACVCVFLAAACERSFGRRKNLKVQGHIMCLVFCAGTFLASACLPACLLGHAACMHAASEPALFVAMLITSVLFLFVFVFVFSRRCDFWFYRAARARRHGECAVSRFSLYIYLSVTGNLLGARQLLHNTCNRLARD